MEDLVDTKWLQDSLVEDFAEARKTWDGPLPSKTFTIPSQDLLNPLKVYMSNAIILFFPGKMPSANDVAQWINAMFKVYAVSGVYFAARGFYEVLLSEPKYKTQLLEESPLTYRDQMVHALPWSLTKDYQGLIRHKCPVWVEVLDFPRNWNHLLPTIAAGMGRVVCPPKTTSTSNRFCILWDTDVPILEGITLNSDDPIIGARPFKLKWGKFAGACYTCNKFGHMQSECPTLTIQPPETAMLKPVSLKENSQVSSSKAANQSMMQPIQKPRVQDKGKSKVPQTIGNVQSNLHDLKQSFDVDKENNEGWQISKKSFRSKTPVVVRNYTHALENQGSSLQINASMLSSVSEAWKRVSRGSYVDICKDGSNADITLHANKHGGDTNMQSD